MRRWLLLLLYMALLSVVWHYRHDVLEWMRSGQAPLYMSLPAVTLLAFVPVVPYGLVIGLMGRMYGALAGALISWAGAWVAAVAMYGLFRSALRLKGKAYIERHKGFERWTSWIERHPFGFVLLSRLTPVLPQDAVNIYAAVAGVPFPAYAAASALGKLPGMLVFAFIGRHLAANWHSSLAVAGVYACFLLAVYGTYRVWARN
ncbi:TVP38/TMEM64 family protein [Paenibacillus humicola]|uniref:TVP38/TMEM64 family protein n=1 Tax=Paenibacillus humicola TaxID=3110540 RepID=UPI00237B5028|nr:VTT domain-containing protein [Paenibacillus humicola]